MAAQNPANVKMIVEPLLPQRVPPPGGRIHRPLGGSGGFDPAVVGDPVLENGLSLPPSRDSSSGDEGRLMPSLGSGRNGGSSSSLPPTSSGIRPSLKPVDGIQSSSGPIGGGNGVNGGALRGRPRPVDLGPSHHLPPRDPTSRLPGGRPASSGTVNEVEGGSGEGGPLGGPIDDLFSGRDPHAHRARPGSSASAGDNRHYATGPAAAGAEGRGGGGGDGLDDSIRPNEYSGELGGRDLSSERDPSGRGIGGGRPGTKSQFCDETFI